MIEQEQINQLGIEQDQKGEFPLIDKWMESLVPAMQKRNEIASGNADLEIPDLLIPMQKLWTDVGPVIVTSYSHPETINFYKYVGGLNLNLVLSELERKGFNIPKDRIMENWYDTVDLDSTVKKPLSFGDVISLNTDLLGLSQTASSFEPLTFSNQEFEVEQVARKILEKLTNELLAQMQEQNFDRKNRNLALLSLEALLKKRINTVTRTSRNAFFNSPYQSGTKVGQFLFEFGQRFGGLIMSNDPDKSKSSDVTGIEGILASDNVIYTNLVLDTIDYLMSAEGADVLKNLAPATEELFLGTFDGKRCSIAIDERTGQFAVFDRKTKEVKRNIPDKDLISFVKQNGFIPFGKTETLAMIAGGVTFHMGSERGEREKAINALGIDCDEFREFIQYLMSLRIGQDVEQGNYLLSVETVPGKSKPVPAILAYVLFGEDFLSNRMQMVAGKTNMAMVLTKDDFKKLAAEKLFAEVIP